MDTARVESEEGEGALNEHIQLHAASAFATRKGRAKEGRRVSQIDRNRETE